MQLSLSFLALALLSFSASAAPSANETEPTNDLVKRSVHCETSGGSPDTGDARAAAQWLQNIHQNSPDTDNCCQNNAGGFPGCMSCEEAGNGLLDIANSCSSFGRSGGWADAPFELRLIISREKRDEWGCYSVPGIVPRTRAARRQGAVQVIFSMSPRSSPPCFSCGGAALIPFGAFSPSLRAPSARSRRGAVDPLHASNQGIMIWRDALGKSLNTEHE
ncbi:hypothetical protein C8J57DRAFT_1255938 [Mycena rebaudengoi]|nr:hypothetical protein C8J57DRAFT_1255938 [Mycena rebaudengoi]